ncbi:hypothetical protein AMST5_00877 [freshwater sediment metagenome]|uniref:Transposase DDE domain-containing protein n=1 Tax=freshwater sediment metagenome TaxID=556182 RepID=A0AA48LXN9_9ZZZZ
MIERRADRPTRITLAADKGYEAENFVNELRSMLVTPDVVHNVSGRPSAIDRRTTRHTATALASASESGSWTLLGRPLAGAVAGQEKTKFQVARGQASPSPWQPPQTAC